MDRNTQEGATSIDAVVHDVWQGTDRFIRVEYLPAGRSFPLVFTHLELNEESKWLVRPGRRLALPLPGSVLAMPSVRLRALVDRCFGDNSPDALFDEVLADLRSLERRGGLFDQFVDAIEWLLEADEGGVYWAVVHGDFNLENVLYDEGSHELWAIDFAKTGLGPPAIDYIAFEVACRFDLLAGALAQCGDFPGEAGKGSSAWMTAARSLLEAFESSIYSVCRVDLRALGVKCDTASAARIRAGWQAILSAREFAFERFYPDPAVRIVYELLLALFGLRVLQRYRSLVRAEHAPLGLLWAQILFERSAARTIAYVSSRRSAIP